MLHTKIMHRTAKIGVVGLGYVGLSLAVEFSKAGFNTIGIDTDEGTIDRINRDLSHVMDIPDASLNNENLQVTMEYESLASVDAAIICVPTPLSKTREPDLSYIVSATDEIAKHLHNEEIVILESTTYPGTTREIVLPRLESRGARVGKDFYLAFSSERIDPGNKKYSLKDIPKLVGGITPDCTKAAALLYSQICESVVNVSTPEIAEMAKIFENIFRGVNIALVNELAMLCDRMNLDVWEVIEAASTKPFGFMPFYPGPGLGGHCIPVDPYYLSWKARQYDFHTRFIELAGEINQNMLHYSVSKIAGVLNEHGKSVKSAKILILGITYKKDVNDIRESPSLKLLEVLQGKGADISYNDPYVGEVEVGGKYLKSEELTGSLLNNKDLVVIATDHSCYNYDWIAKNSNPLLNLRGRSRQAVHDK